MFIIGCVVAAFAIVIGGKLYLLKRDVGDYAAYWQQRASRPAHPESLLYVALGDSTAQGLGASHPEAGYVGLITEALKDKTDKPVHVINLSKSGATISDCLRDQIPKLAELRPAVVTIEIGANDLKNWDEIAFERDMKLLMTQLPSKTIISDMPYFGGGRMQDLEPTAQRASAIIKILAKNRGLALAPLHKITKEKDSLRAYSIDFFHPSNHGYKNWFEAFWSVLK